MTYWSISSGISSAVITSCSCASWKQKVESITTVHTRVYAYTCLVILMNMLNLRMWWTKKLSQQTLKRWARYCTCVMWFVCSPDSARQGGPALSGGCPVFYRTSLDHHPPADFDHQMNTPKKKEKIQDHNLSLVICLRLHVHICMQASPQDNLSDG